MLAGEIHGKRGGGSPLSKELKWVFYGIFKWDKYLEVDILGEFHWNLMYLFF